jgi:hypothetical protein
MRWRAFIWLSVSIRVTAAKRYFSCCRINSMLICSAISASASSYIPYLRSPFPQNFSLIFWSDSLKYSIISKPFDNLLTFVVFEKFLRCANQEGFRRKKIYDKEQRNYGCKESSNKRYDLANFSEFLIVHVFVCWFREVDLKVITTSGRILVTIFERTVNSYNSFLLISGKGH